MVVEIIDKTGKPRSDEDLLEAIQLTSDLLRNPPMNLPRLVLNLPNIRDLLVELLHRRKEA